MRNITFVRAAERVDVSRMRRCARAFPKIADYVSPENPEARTSPGFWRLKELAVQLARLALTEDLEQLQRDRAADPAAFQTQTKSNILTKLKRLLPGCTNSVAAMQCEDGRVTGAADEMAAALKAHWERVFRAPPGA